MKFPLDNYDIIVSPIYNEKNNKYSVKSIIVFEHLDNQSIAHKFSDGKEFNTEQECLDYYKKELKSIINKIKNNNK